MTTEKTYKFVVDWLVGEIKPRYEGTEIEKYAHGGHKPLKGIISSLWSLFDDVIREDRLHRIRYADKSLYVFNGEYYERVGKEFLREVVLRVLIELNVSAAYRMTAPAQIAQQSLDRIACSEVYEFKPNRRYVVFRNGTFDVSDGKLKAFDARYCTDLVMDYAYLTQKQLDIEAAKDGGHNWHNNYAKLWGQKLNEVIPNKDLQADFQQFCGSLLLDRDLMKVEYYCFLISNGANGKSTISQAVAGVFPSDKISTFSPQEIFCQGASSMFVVNELKGKILNLCDDLDFAKTFEGGRMKGFISGEYLTGCGKYSTDYVKVKPPMLLVCGNDFPQTSDDSWGHHRRQMIIQCTNELPKEVDRELSAKLRTDIAKQQIFLWLYEGAKRVMRQRGIELSDECKKAMLDRRANSSPMRIWASENKFCKAVPVDNKDPRWYSLVDLYAQYRQYCVSRGYRYEADARKISAMFVSMGCEKRNICGKGTKVCVGRLGIDADEDGRIIYP